MIGSISNRSPVRALVTGSRAAAERALTFVWRVRGRGRVRLLDERFTFVEIGRPPHDWWAVAARRQSWEIHALEAFAAAISAGDTVLDIGAYLGPYSLLASRKVGPGGCVIAVEPDPVARSMLARNLVANRISNVQVSESAVLDCSGRCRLSAEQLGNSISRIGDGPIGVPVQAVTLRELCRRYDAAPRVIKVDVEGDESRALAGSAEEVVSAARLILVEIHEAAMRDQGDSPSELTERLARWGKRARVLDRRPRANYTIAYTEQ